MGIHRENGYSATIEAFFAISSTEHIRVAKTNGRTFVVAEPCELLPGTIGDLIVIVDGRQTSKRIVLPNGVRAGEVVVDYKIEAPF